MKKMIVFIGLNVCWFCYTVIRAFLMSLVTFFKNLFSSDAVDEVVTIAPVS